MWKNIVTLIVIVSIADVILASNIISKTLYIEHNLVEKETFRNHKINSELLREIYDFSASESMDFALPLTINYLYNNQRPDKFNIKYKNINRYKNAYMNVYKTEFNKVYNSFKAIYSDLKYFPVAKSDKGNYWVNYEDGFGDTRSFNGAYKHEGCDIMAENNISGYYPIISATDGTVENIGWLPKGGYRVGIRGDNGGYFYYAHLYSYSDIHKNDYIKAGTLLGYMGDTGYGKEGTTGKFDVHLHFGIYIKTENYDELSINPYYILKFLESNILYASY